MQSLSTKCIIIPFIILIIVVRRGWRRGWRREWSTYLMNPALLQSSWNELDGFFHKNLVGVFMLLANLNIKQDIVTQLIVGFNNS